jgi:hypothetical protein
MSVLWDVYIVYSIILLFWNIIASERVMLYTIQISHKYDVAKSSSSY